MCLEQVGDKKRQPVCVCDYFPAGQLDLIIFNNII